ncbi:30S ribosomal protein S17 [Candidatus Gottesmanbacteria bacterium]|nr:30S ribosomal protein S17 [Candidatus Gottesmanbacteria bacterium]
MKALVGRVVSTKMTKTVVVEVEKFRLHPLYKKYIRRTKRIKADYHDQSIKEGDMVKIVPTRPISKEKHFKVVGKINK